MLVVNSTYLRLLIFHWEPSQMFTFNVISTQLNFVCSQYLAYAAFPSWISIFISINILGTCICSVVILCYVDIVMIACVGRKSLQHKINCIIFYPFFPWCEHLSLPLPLIIYSWILLTFSGSLGSLSSRGTLYKEVASTPSDVVTW